MFSVRNVYSGRFNPGAGDEPGAGVPRRDISLHVAAETTVAAVTEEHPGRGGRGGRGDEEEAEESFRSGYRFHARHRVFSNVAHCLVDTSLSPDRRVPNAAQDPRSSGRCNCISPRFSLLRHPLAPTSIRPDRRRGLQSEDVSLSDFPSP